MSKSNKRAPGELIYDYLVLEAERFSKLRKEEQDLYFRNSNGEYVKIGVAYESEVEELANKVLNRRKARFFITFIETMDLEDSLTRMEFRILRYMARIMGYNNQIANLSYNDMESDIKSHFRYLQKGVNNLLERDVIRFITHKNRRTYMLNPVYYYKGNTIGIFRALKIYKSFPSWDDYVKDKENKESEKLFTFK